MAPVGAKIVETTIDKWGPYRNFDLDNPESFRDAKLKNVERYMDKHLNNKNEYVKKMIKRGEGVRYFNDKGSSYRLNYGYNKPIFTGADNIHTKPYLTTTVGSEVVRIPLK